MMQKSPLKSRFANDILKIKGGFAMNFISVFAICLIVSYISLSLFLIIAVECHWLGFALIFIIPAVLLNVLVNFSSRIKKLEKRISELEAHSTEKSSE